MSGPLGETELVVSEPRGPGDFSDLYALTKLRCSTCSSIWKQYRLAGSSLKPLRCPGCGKRTVDYHDGEPGRVVLHYMN